MRQTWTPVLGKLQTGACSRLGVGSGGGAREHDGGEEQQEAVLCGLEQPSL